MRAAASVRAREERGALAAARRAWSRLGSAVRQSAWFRRRRVESSQREFAVSEVRAPTAYAVGALIRVTMSYLRSFRNNPQAFRSVQPFGAVVLFCSSIVIGKF